MSTEPPSSPVAGDRVGALARRVGAGGTLALYAVAVAALIVVIRLLDRSAVVASIVLTLGALHLFFDGVIWRSPRPTAASSGVTPSRRDVEVRPHATLAVATHERS